METVIIKDVSGTVTVGYGGKLLGNTVARFGGDADANFAKFIAKFPGKTAYIMSAPGKDNILEVDSIAPEAIEKIDADAFITKNPSALLVLKAADCIPLVFYSPGQQILALAHVGTSGAVLRLPSKVVKTLDITPESLHVYVGPSISQKSYRFPEDQFEKKLDYRWDNYVIHEVDGVHINLLGYVLNELKEVGILAENIQLESVDTGSDDGYFSHRRHKLTGEPDGRNTFCVHLS